MGKKGLIVFIKYPEKGKVKTRLAKALGENFAHWFYKTCAENILNEIEKLNSNEYSIYIFYTGNEEKIKNWVNRDFIFKKQKGINLGERMKNSFKEVFNSGINKVVIIGTDIPDIYSEIINDAFNSLDNSELVIGPSKDGGYYLMGMKHLHKFLFEDIDWSTEKVLNQTLLKLKQNNINAVILKGLNDIDTGDDLKEWLNDDLENSFKTKVILEIERLEQKD